MLYCPIYNSETDSASQCLDHFRIQISLQSFAKSRGRMKVPDVRRNLVPDTWTADGEGALRTLAAEFGKCKRNEREIKERRVWREKNKGKKGKDRKVRLLEMCGNIIFVPNPPPHFNDFILIPIAVWKLNLIPNISHRAILNSFPFLFPFGKSTEASGYLRSPVFLQAVCCADPQPIVLDKLKKANELTIECIDSTQIIRCQLERTITK